MNRFRSRRARRPDRDADPTEVLQYWRDQQREERLADSRELPELLESEQPRDTMSKGTSLRARHFRVLLVAAVGVSGLIVAGALVGSAADGPTGRNSSQSATTTAPSDGSTGLGDTSGPTAQPSSSGDADGSGGGGPDGSATPPEVPSIGSLPGPGAEPRDRPSPDATPPGAAQGPSDAGPRPGAGSAGPLPGPV